MLLWTFTCCKSTLIGLKLTADTPRALYTVDRRDCDSRVCVCVCLYLGGAQRFGEGLPARALPLPLVRHLWLCVVVVHTVHTELREEPQRGEPHTAHGHAHTQSPARPPALACGDADLYHAERPTHRRLKTCAADRTKQTTTHDTRDTRHVRHSRSRSQAHR
mgnify:CR=1 FL=1